MKAETIEALLQQQFVSIQSLFCSYQELMRQVRNDEDVDVIVQKDNELRQALDGKSVALEQAKKERDHFEEQLKSSNAENQRLRDENAKLNADSRPLSGTEDMTSADAHLLQQNANLAKENVKLTKERDEALAENAQLKHEWNEQCAEVGRLTAAVKALQKECDAHKGDVEDAIQANLKLGKERDQAVEDVVARKGQLTIMLANQRETIEELQAENDELREKHKLWLNEGSNRNLADALKSTQQALNYEKEKVASAETARDEAIAETEKRNHQLADALAEVKELQAENDKMRHRLKLIEEVFGESNVPEDTC